MKIITVFKTHFDIGYTKLSREMIEEYGGEMLERAVAVCEATQSRGRALEYKWTMPAWPLFTALETATASLRKRAETLIERGQLLWHALPFTLHTEFCTTEELIRGLRFAKELSERYRKPYPVSAKMTDVPGHTRYLVSALAKAGVRFLHLGCNPASTPPDIPMLFFWEAADGERILTFYNKTYGSQALPPKDWKYPVWLNMCLTNDNAGPQGPEAIDALLSECEDNELCVGSMDDFYFELSKCDLSDVPIIKAELSDTWIHGVGTYPKEVGMLCDARRKLASIERKYALSEYDGETEAMIGKAYDQALLFCEHTWGLDVKTTLGEARHYEKESFEKERREPRYLRLEESWQEQRLRAEKYAEYVNLLGEKYEVKEVKEEAEEEYSAVFDGEKVVISYARQAIAELFPPIYHIAGKDELTNYERSYLRRLYFWAIADFGRLSYPETETFYFKPEKLEWTKEKEGNVLVCTYPAEAAERFGMAKIVRINISFGNGIRADVSLEKSATPFLESCSLPIRFIGTEKFVYYKTGGGVKPNEIAVNANRVANCVWKVSCGGTEIVPLHSPLLSRNGDLLCRFEPELIPKDHTAFFNLFNNMWGTNFPQYLEGKFSFSFLIRKEKKRREDSLGCLKIRGGYIAGVKRRKDGTIVRIANPDAEAAAIEIQGAERIRGIDHFERKGELLPKDDGYHLPLRPYEIVSLFIERLWEK